MKRGFAALGGGGLKWAFRVGRGNQKADELWSFCGLDIQSPGDSIAGGDIWEKMFYSGKRLEAF